MNSCETTEGAVSGLLASNRWRCVCYERDLYYIPLNTIPAYQQIAIAQKWIYLIFSLRVNTAMELTKVNPFCLNHSRNFRNLTKWLWSRVRRLGESWIRKLAKFDESRCRSIESQAWKIILHVGEMELGEFFPPFSKCGNDTSVSRERDKCSASSKRDRCVFWTCCERRDFCTW